MAGLPPMLTITAQSQRGFCGGFCGGSNMDVQSTVIVAWVLAAKARWPLMRSCMRGTWHGGQSLGHGVRLLKCARPDEAAPGKRDAQGNREDNRESVKTQESSARRRVVQDCDVADRSNWQYEIAGCICQELYQ